MLPGSDVAVQVAAYATTLAAVGHFMLRVDLFVHSPASLKKDIDAISARLNDGNRELSTSMGRINTKIMQQDEHINAVDLRVTRLEALDEADRRRHPR